MFLGSSNTLYFSSTRHKIFWYSNDFGFRVSSTHSYVKEKVRFETDLKYSHSHKQSPLLELFRFGVCPPLKLCLQQLPQSASTLCFVFIKTLECKTHCRTCNTAHCEIEMILLFLALLLHASVKDPLCRDSGNDFRVPEIGSDNSGFSFILFSYPHVIPSSSSTRPSFLGADQV